MSRYDEFRTLFAEATAEKKLWVIRSEAKRLTSTALGYSAMMLRILDDRTPADLPDDFRSWVQQIATSAKELRDLIEALTDPHHRHLLQQEQAVRDLAFNEMLWHHQQAGLTELQGSASFTEAVEEAARHLGLPLNAGSLAEPIQTHAWFHPAGYVEFITTARKARIDAQASPDDGRYFGYAVTLTWCSDHRNNIWQEAAGLAPSLEQVVLALHRWLAGQEDLEVIVQTIPWMHKGAG